MYKDKEKQREYNKKRMAKVRGNTEGNTGSPTPESEQPDAWKKLSEFIKRGNNLEKLQRIGGSLGKYSNEVWMGGLNLLEIGSVIGTKPGLYAK